ncbi:MAG TPA: hypothetical protein VL614_14960 [Acetobacteraceae bacterium]|nr:hypothetical protein [Acetobacteraceae bacterium]
MNHARRNNCKTCGTPLPVPAPKPGKPAKSKAKPPSGPPRAAYTGVLTKATKASLTRKANQQSVLQDPVATSLVANTCEDPPILTDIKIAEAAFIPPAPPPPPAPPVVAAPEPVGPTGPYFTVRECRVMLPNGTLALFPANKVIDDLHMIRVLLAEDMPIVPVSEVANIVCCPNCKHVFKREQPPVLGKE